MRETTVNIKYQYNEYTGLDENDYSFKPKKGVYKLPVIKVTVKEVYDAIKKNGFEHLRGEWFDSTDGKFKGGCVLGQAALNLSVVPEPEFVNNGDLQLPNLPENFFDFEGEVAVYSLVEQLNQFYISDEQRLSEHGYVTSRFTLGDAIIGWNDHIYTKLNSVGAIESFYTLPTYDDVAKKCYELMKPFFKRTITLVKHQYPIGEKAA